MSAGHAWHVEVLHGVNLDQLGHRDPHHYGSLTLAGLEQRIAEQAVDAGLAVAFFQTNFEGAFVEHLHSLRGRVHGVILNPGAWTHYSWAIRDALELTDLPAAEVHLSDIHGREQWRQLSVLEGLTVASISGRGADGYAEALGALRAELDRRAAAA